tara:strand:+ start:476 stop:634 length:159 start_codon:yes stop_codon:yes gene_type:complete
MKQEAFAHISKNGGQNLNHFIMASNDVRPLGNYDVTANNIARAPATTISPTM